MRSSIKIISAVAIAVALFVCADLVLGGIMSYWYYHSKYGIFRRQIYSLTESDEDILILGSSRAAHHYVPSVFKDSLGMTCFNAGSDGMCIYYHYAVLSSYLASGRIPRMVIYDVNDFDLTRSTSATFTLEAALDRLTPHYGEYLQIDSLFGLKGWQENVKMLLQTYRYNSKLVQLIKCNLLPSTEDNGYEAVYGELAKGTELREVSDGQVLEIEEGKKNYFIKMMDTLQSYNIPLLLVYSPIYEKGHSNRIAEIVNIADKYGVRIWDYSNKENLMNPALFKDNLHLNDKGAHLFTKLLVNSIAEYESESN